MFGQQVAVGSNKQICSYYLKGTCKYGAKCWYYHPPNQGGGGGGGSGGGVFGASPSVFGGKAGGQQDSKEFTDFVKQVSGEMTQWERSGQWLVSSFSPLKAHPPLVGFSDTSPEEFRIDAYTANKTNTCAAYQAKWVEVQQTFKQLREALKMSTAEAVQALRDVFYSKSPLEQQQQVLKQPAGLFGKTSGGSMFGGSSSAANTGPGLLGAAPQAAQGSLFGAATPSIFGGGAAQTPATPSIFGGAAATAKPLFGTQTSVLGTSGGSVFGAQPAAATAAPSVFGAAPATPQAATPGSLFGATPQASAQTPGSVFGTASTAQATPTPTAQTSIFGQQQQQQQQQQGGLFGSQPQQAQQGSLFGSQAPQQQQQQPQQTSLFGAQPQQQTSLFGGQQQQQQTQQAGGLFGAQPQQQQQQQQSAGLFGAQPQQQQAQQPGSLFGAQPQQQQQSAGLFGAQPQQQQQAGGLFGAQPQQQQQQQQQAGGLFGAQPQASTTTATPGIFSGGAAASQPQGAAGSIFGGTPFGGIKPGLFGGGGEAAPKPGLFGKPAEPVPGLFGQGHPTATQAAPSQGSHNYTPLDQLSAEDRAQFEAEAFTFVPLCPPPLELCA